MTANGTLMNHFGASLVTKGDLEIIPAPPPTETWFPVRHLDVLDGVEETLGSAGFEIRNYQLSVSHRKQRFFGVLDIATPLADGVTLSIGVRNSNDKSYAELKVMWSWAVNSWKALVFSLELASITSE